MLVKRWLPVALIATGIAWAVPSQAQIPYRLPRRNPAATGGYQPLSGANTGPWAYRPLSSGWTGLNGTNTGPWAYRPLSSGWKRPTSGYTPPPRAYRTAKPTNPSQRVGQ